MLKLSDKAEKSRELMRQARALKGDDAKAELNGLLADYGVDNLEEGQQQVFLLPNIGQRIIATHHPAHERVQDIQAKTRLKVKADKKEA